MGDNRRNEMFGIHKKNILAILERRHAGRDDELVNEIAAYITTRISQVIRKERKKRELPMQRKGENYGVSQK